MKIRSTLILLAMISTCGVALSQAQSPSMLGSWTVKITFANGAEHSLRFDAQDGGKGSLELTDPQAKLWSATASKAQWVAAEGGSVSFSGPVEFPLGNVGRDPGTLMFKGKFETANSITGEVEFSPSVGEGPSKHGTFKAFRAE